MTQLKVRTFVSIILLFGLIIGGTIGYQLSQKQIENIKSEIRTQEVLHNNQVDKITKVHETIVNELELRVNDLTIQLGTKTVELYQLNQEKKNLDNELSKINEQRLVEADQMVLLKEEIWLKNNETLYLRTLVGEYEKIASPYENGEWNQVLLFNGMGTMFTPLFNIPYRNARVKWGYSQVDAFPYLKVDLKNSESQLVWSSGVLQENSGETYLYNMDEGEYYLEIFPSLGLDRWTIIVEIWIPV